MYGEYAVADNFSHFLHWIRLPLVDLSQYQAILWKINVGGLVILTERIQLH